MYGFLTLLALAALALQTDPGSAVGPLGTLGSYALGIGSVFLTAGIKSLTQKGDAAIGKADTAITNAIKPVQPLVATGLMFALPWLGAKLHFPGLGALDPATVAHAPLGVLAGITGLELFKKLVAKIAPAGPPA